MTTKINPDLKIPFRPRNGQWNPKSGTWDKVDDNHYDMVQYDGYSQDDYIIYENKPIEMTIQLVGIDTGRSRCNAIFSDLPGYTRYYMFLSEFERLMAQPQLWKAGLTISGSWAYRKQGANYSLMMVEK